MASGIDVKAGKPQFAPDQVDWEVWKRYLEE